MGTRNAVKTAGEGLKKMPAAFEKYVGTSQPMIISRTPVRIPLGGGGTDLPAYSQKYGGMLLSAAVNKYVYIIVKKHFENTVRFSGYHRKEVVAGPEEILHPVVHAVLKMLKIGRGIEIVSLSDVPANVGLGTSSSFTVGLLCALHAYLDENPSPLTLAQEALTIERQILKEAGGVQDQYIAAYGGLVSMDIGKKGDVGIEPLKMDPETIETLESRLIFFYTNLQRDSTQIQANNVDAISKGAADITESLHRIKEIGVQTKKAFETGDLDQFGRLMDEHWKNKRKMSKDISNNAIDSWYKMAINAGALGGKLLGAGGGGFMMFYCQNGVKDRIRAALSKEGLKEISFRFEPKGSRIILHT